MTGSLVGQVLFVNDTTVDIAHRKAAKANATAMRDAETEKNTATIAEATEAWNAVQAAMDVLNAFYANTTMFPEPPAQSGHVLGLLQVTPDCVLTPLTR